MFVSPGFPSQAVSAGAWERLCGRRDSCGENGALSLRSAHSNGVKPVVEVGQGSMFFASSLLEKGCSVLCYLVCHRHTHAHSL